MDRPVSMAARVRRPRRLLDGPCGGQQMYQRLITRAAKDWHMPGAFIALDTTSPQDTTDSSRRPSIPSLSQLLIGLTHLFDRCFVGFVSHSWRKRLVAQTPSIENVDIESACIRQAKPKEIAMSAPNQVRVHSSTLSDRDRPAASHTTNFQWRNIVTRTAFTHFTQSITRLAILAGILGAVMMLPATASAAGRPIRPPEPAVPAFSFTAKSLPGGKGVVLSWNGGPALAEYTVCWKKADKLWNPCDKWLGNRIKDISDGSIMIQTECATKYEFVLHRQKTIFAWRRGETTDPCSITGTIACPHGGWHDGVGGCSLGPAPSGTNAFLWAGYYYHSPQPGNVCSLPDSWFDGYNCQVMKVPTGVVPFIWDNSFYYKSYP